MKQQTLTQKAVAAMQTANRKVVAEHKEQNRPLAVWQDGKVLLIRPDAVPMAAEKETKCGA